MATAETCSSDPASLVPLAAALDTCSAMGLALKREARTLREGRIGIQFVWNGRYVRPALLLVPSLPHRVPFLPLIVPVLTRCHLTFFSMAKSTGVHTIFSNRHRTGRQRNICTLFSRTPAVSVSRLPVSRNMAGFREDPH